MKQLKLAQKNKFAESTDLKALIFGIYIVDEPSWIHIYLPPLSTDS